MTDLLLTETAHDVIIRASELADPCEAGGLLLGVHEGRRSWVTHALVIPSGRPSPSHYELPAGVTQPLVRCAQQVDPRLGYIGEWHSHPADQGPSHTDGETMSRLEPDRRKRSPILLLARRGPKGYRLKAYRWYRRMRHSPTLRMTGALPDTKVS